MKKKYKKWKEILKNLNFGLSVDTHLYICNVIITLQIHRSFTFILQIKVIASGSVLKYVNFYVSMSSHKY